MNRKSNVKIMAFGALVLSSLAFFEIDQAWAFMHCKTDADCPADTATEDYKCAKGTDENGNPYTNGLCVVGPKTDGIETILIDLLGLSRK